jgi:hypothetical protein
MSIRPTSRLRRFTPAQIPSLDGAFGRPLRALLLGLFLLTAALVAAQDGSFDVEGGSLLELHENLRYYYAMEDFATAKKIVAELKKRNAGDEKAALYEEMIADAPARKAKSNPYNVGRPEMDPEAELIPPLRDGQTPPLRVEPSLVSTSESVDAADPVPPTPTPYTTPRQVGFIDQVPGGWATIGAVGGVLAVLILILALRGRGKNTILEPEPSKTTIKPVVKAAAVAAVHERPDADVEIDTPTLANAESLGPIATETAVEDGLPEIEERRADDSFAPWETASDKAALGAAGTASISVDIPSDEELDLLDEPIMSPAPAQSPKPGASVIHLHPSDAEEDVISLDHLDGADSSRPPVSAEVENPLDLEPAHSPIRIDDVLGAMPETPHDKTFFESNEETLVSDRAQDSVFHSDDYTVPAETPPEAQQPLYNLLEDDPLVSDDETYFGSQNNTRVSHMKKGDMADSDKEDTKPD